MRHSAVKIDMVGHGGFYNRGCEAIVRSTMALLKDGGLDCRFRLFSFDAEQDRSELVDGDVEVIAAKQDRTHQINSHSRGRRLAAGIRRRYWRPGLMATALVERLEPMLECQRTRAKVDCALSIGGDNFSMDYGGCNFYVDELAHYRKRGVPTVIWGASVGSFSEDKDVERKMAKFLKQVTLITVREGVSQEYLASLGVTDNVVRVWDPAFFLIPSALDSDITGYLAGSDVIGINVSSLIARWYPHGDLDHLLAEFAGFVDFLVEQGWRILLVPHVTKASGVDAINDEAVLLRLRDKCRASNGQIRVLSGRLPAGRIKGAISRCRFFIGARTHSTIAAVSTGVPTIGIAYSNKARGIWRDVFGDEELVLPVSQISGAALHAKWEMLCGQEHSLRKLLADKRSEMMDGARRNVEALLGIL